MNLVPLDDKKTIKQLVAEDIDSSIIEAIEKELASDKFNYVVTEENLKATKIAMANLNKYKDNIDDFRKAKVAAESDDIEKFKKNIKIYLKLIQDKRDELQKNANIYIEKTKKAVKVELDGYLSESLASSGLRSEFNKVCVDDLVITGNITPKGALKGSAKKSVDALIGVCKAKQDKYDMRVMQLENESHKAGLNSPLTVDYIQGIVHIEDDSLYAQKLDTLIQTELNRQNETKAKIEREAKTKAEREAQQKVLSEQNRIRNLFTTALGSGSTVEMIDHKINEFVNYDFAHFGDFEEFARTQSQVAISSLNLAREELSNQNLKEQLIEETKLSTQEEIYEQIVEPTQTKPEFTPPPQNNISSHDGRKIVKIQAIWAISVPIHVSDEAVLNKVSKELDKRDAKGESFESLEVV